MAELPVVKRLRKEMEGLKRELNVELPKELERARAHGDLSENAEWAMAKQSQEFLRDGSTTWRREWPSCR